MNAIGFFGKHVITAGSYDGDVYITRSDGKYKKLFYGDNRLKGYILVDMPECAGIYTSMIRESTPLDSVDFELIKLQPRLMAFTAETRAKKLNG
jgi:hypothetical protein